MILAQSGGLTRGMKAIFCHKMLAAARRDPGYGANISCRWYTASRPCLITNTRENISAPLDGP